MLMLRKAKAVSYGRIGQMEAHLQAEIDRLFQLAEDADGTDDDVDIDNEIQRRRHKLETLAAAKAVLEARAAERDAAAEAEYQAKLAARQAKEARTGKKMRGRPPQATSIWSQRQRPVQLHRPGVSYHEKWQQKGL